jgi:hypothetical protein
LRPFQSQRIEPVGVNNGLDSSLVSLIGRAQVIECRCYLFCNFRFSRVVRWKGMTQV